MPPKNESPHRHLNQAPQRRGRSKPKFEMPVDTMRPEAPVAWVYRADEVAILKSPPKPMPAVARDEAEEPGILLMAGMALIAIGTGTIGFISVAALNFSAIPFRLAKRMLARG
jgi:hypothetical protein